MRTKKVTRHYCDHCGKGMFTKPAMIRHEAICFANPHRSCPVCGCEDANVELLKESLEKKGMEGLKQDAMNCPACMASAVRLANVGEDRNDEDGDWIYFDYKAAMAAFNAEKMALEMEEEEARYMHETTSPY